MSQGRFVTHIPGSDQTSNGEANPILGALPAGRLSPPLDHCPPSASLR